MACIPNIRTSKFMKKILNNNLNAFVYCKFNNKFKKWEPISECPNSFEQTNVSELNTIQELENN